jgi:bifunctional UDP-N-acetylglucosamine pyrophosphorylase/glucosamine-1-phosphate N-acetyltransferase
MKAVIIAAGESTRTHPLTVGMPKPLLKVANKEIIRHNMESLAGLVEEFIIVVGFRKEMVMESLGAEFMGRPVVYVEQKERLGTGHALLQAEKHAKGRTMVLMGDDLYGKKDMERCARHDNCVLAKEVSDPEKFGVFILKDGKVADVIEKPKKHVGNLANTGFYMFSPAIFGELKKIKKSERGEYELTDAVKLLASHAPVACEMAEDYWLPIGYPWHLLEANGLLLQRMKPAQEGTIEPNTVLKGNVSVGGGTIIRSGSYIEGPVAIGEGCDIGPNCFIRPSTSIGNRCRVGNGVEVKNSILMDGVKIGHLSYFGDSIIGSNASIGAGTIAANLRHDGSNVKTKIKGCIVDTGRRKFGAVIGSGARTGINTSIYPGRKIWPNRTTLPGEIIREDRM